jgi:hypothetical protein
MTDVIETLARALLRELNDTVQYEDLHPEVKHNFDKRATALLAKIAPALRAEGMEMAAAWCAEEADMCDDAVKWGGARAYIANCKAAAYALRNAANKHRAEAKRLREGGEG